MKLVDPEGNVIYNQNSADYSKVVEAIEKASNLNAADYVDFSAVYAAWDAVNLGLDASHQAEVDAMAKAIEDAIAALVEKADTPVTPDEPTEPTKPVTPEQPGTSQKHVQVKQSEITEVTSVVKELTGCETVEELIAFMQHTVAKDEYADASSVVWEVEIQIGTVLPNGVVDWKPATKETMPEGGVDIYLPYPKGTNKVDYDFTVSHLVTQDWDTAKKPGTVEELTPVKEDNGLKVHVTSASPFAVAWKPVANDDDGSNDEGESGQNVTTTAMKTGDNMNVSAIIWSIVLLAAAAGAGVLVYRRRKENGIKSE